MKTNYLPTVDIRDLTVQPALCLDLDGTVRYSTAGKFINKPSDIALFDGVEEKLWEYRNQDHLIIGLSNQGGVAFNIKTPQQEMEEIDATLALFKRNPFHLLKTCWFHEKGKNPVFGHRSLFRKPFYGMLAMCEFEAFNSGIIIDWDKSLMVGDRYDDSNCAYGARIPFFWAWDFFGREKPADAEASNETQNP